MFSRQSISAGEPFAAVHSKGPKWQPYCLSQGVIDLVDTKEKQMRALWNRVSIGWCRTFHEEPFWPIHGCYHCPTCLRTYPVPWHEGNDFVRRQSVKADSSGQRTQPFVLAFEKDRV